jgi:hypothetical protein
MYMLTNTCTQTSCISVYVYIHIRLDIDIHKSVVIHITLRCSYIGNDKYHVFSILVGIYFLFCHLFVICFFSITDIFSNLCLYGINFVTPLVVTCLHRLSSGINSSLYNNKEFHCLRLKTISKVRELFMLMDTCICEYIFIYIILSM